LVRRRSPRSGPAAGRRPAAGPGPRRPRGSGADRPGAHFRPGAGRRGPPTRTASRRRRRPAADRPARRPAGPCDRSDNERLAYPGAAALCGARTGRELIRLNALSGTWMADWLAAIILGLVEGLTEFIPVSSTGHMLLLGHFLGFESTGKTFEIVIQLGALLAIVSVYFKRLWELATRWPFDPEARRFLIGLLVAFAPAVVIGFLAYDFIKTILFETPLVICIALIIGGVLLLWLDRIKKVPTFLEADRYPLRVYFLIGLFQCLAMV